MNKYAKEIKKLRNKADKLYQEVGRMINKKCLICGGLYNCLHHYFPKSTSTALRYNLNNGIPICNGCHFAHHNGNPTIHSTVLRKKGFDWEKNLLKEKQKITKTNKEFYKKNIEKLNSIANNYE